MFTLTTLSLLMALPVAADKKETPKAAEPKIYARTSIGIIQKSVVVKSSQQLSFYSPSNAPAGGDEAALARVLKVESIDWKKQMVIFISGGTQRTGGYSVETKSLEIKDGKLIVHWKLNTPKGIVTQALTHPTQALLVDRFEGDVVFDPTPPADKK